MSVPDGMADQVRHPAGKKILTSRLERNQAKQAHRVETRMFVGRLCKAERLLLLQARSKLSEVNRTGGIARHGKAPCFQLVHAAKAAAVVLEICELLHVRGSHCLDTSLGERIA